MDEGAIERARREIEDIATGNDIEIEEIVVYGSRTREATVRTATLMSFS
jgi:hypothetical protein